MKFQNYCKGFTLVEIMIVVAIIGIVIAIAIPAFLRARESAWARSCQANLVRIAGAVDSYALDRKLAPSTAVSKENLLLEAGTGYLKAWPECPAKGTYLDSYTVDAHPTCSIGANPDSPVSAPHIMIPGS